VSTPSGGLPPLRIGNLEREAACASLDAHLEAGRLDAEEYGERYATATAARTRAELDVLFHDLPAPHPAASAPVSIAKSAPRLSGDWQRHLPTSAIGRLAAAIVVVAALCLLVPVLAAGAIVWFVVIPMVTGRGCNSRRRNRTWTAATWR